MMNVLACIICFIGNIWGSAVAPLNVSKNLNNNNNLSHSSHRPPYLNNRKLYLGSLLTITALGYVGYKTQHGKKVFQSIKKKLGYCLDSHNDRNDRKARVSSCNVAPKHEAEHASLAFTPWFPNCAPNPEDWAIDDVTRLIGIYELDSTGRVVRRSSGFGYLTPEKHSRVFVVNSTDKNICGGVYCLEENSYFVGSSDYAPTIKKPVKIRTEFLPRPGDTLTHSKNGSKTSINPAIAWYNMMENTISIIGEEGDAIVGPNGFQNPFGNINLTFSFSTEYMGRTVVVESDTAALPGSLSGYFKVNWEGMLSLYWLGTENSSQRWLDAKSIHWVCYEYRTDKKLQSGHYIEHRTFGRCVVIGIMQDESTVIVRLQEPKALEVPYRVIKRNSTDVVHIYKPKDNMRSDLMNKSVEDFFEI